MFCCIYMLTADFARNVLLKACNPSHCMLNIEDYAIFYRWLLVFGPLSGYKLFALMLLLSSPPCHDVNTGIEM